MSEQEKDRTPEGQEPVITLPHSLTKGLIPKHQQYLQENLEQAYSKVVHKGEKILNPLHQINEMVDYVKNPLSLTDVEFLDTIAEEGIFNNLHHILYEKVSPNFGLEILNNVFTNRKEIPHSSGHLQTMISIYTSLSEKLQDENTGKEIEENIAILQEESLKLLEHEASVFSNNIAKILTKLTPDEQREIKREIHKVFDQHFQKKDFEKTKKTFTEKANLYISKISDNPEKTETVTDSLSAISQLFNETPLAFHNDKSKKPRKEQDGVYLRLSLLNELEHVLPKTDASEKPILLLMDMYQPILEYFEKKSRNSGNLWTERNKYDQVKEKVSSLEKRLMKFYKEDEVPF